MISTKELREQIAEIDAKLAAEYKEYGETNYASQLECQLERIEDAIFELEDINKESISKIIVSKIKWDEAPANLPKKITIEVDMENFELLEDIEGYAENLCNYLSNKYEYCIESFDVKLV